MALSFASTSSKNGSVTFTGCSDRKLVLTGVEVLFEPSAFGGDGTETRLGICFKVPLEIAEQVLAFETQLQGNVSSCVKEETLKAKISTDKVRIYDGSKKRSSLPSSWKGTICNVSINIRGKWATRTQTGLSLEVTDVQLLEEKSEPPFPF